MVILSSSSAVSDCTRFFANTTNAVFPVRGDVAPYQIRWRQPSPRNPSRPLHRSTVLGEPSIPKDPWPRGLMQSKCLMQGLVSRSTGRRAASTCGVRLPRRDQDQYALQERALFSKHGLALLHFGLPFPAHHYFQPFPLFRPLKLSRSCTHSPLDQVNQRVKLTGTSLHVFGCLFVHERSWNRVQAV